MAGDGRSWFPGAAFVGGSDEQGEGDDEIWLPSERATSEVGGDIVVVVVGLGGAAGRKGGLFRRTISIPSAFATVFLNCIGI